MRSAAQSLIHSDVTLSSHQTWGFASTGGEISPRVRDAVIANRSKRLEVSGRGSLAAVFSFKGPYGGSKPDLSKAGLGDAWQVEHADNSNAKPKHSTAETRMNLKRKIRQLSVGDDDGTSNGLMLLRKRKSDDTPSLLATYWQMRSLMPDYQKLPTSNALTKLVSKGLKYAADAYFASKADIDPITGVSLTSVGQINDLKGIAPSDPRSTHRLVPTPAKQLI